MFGGDVVVGLAGDRGGEGGRGAEVDVGGGLSFLRVGVAEQWVVLWCVWLRIGGCRRLRVIRVMSVLLLSWCRCCGGRVHPAVAGSEGRMSSGSVSMRRMSWAGWI